ncbi:uncharacterized protein [Dysidea avara]|uniref:uncharacterized protein n=1 Tax=Dysidea avara TaxID=196820 RepID=UPI00332DD61A
MASPETDVTFYDNRNDNLPTTVTADGDSKSPSTSGLAPARSEHLSLQRQPLHEEFSDLVPELATQTTTDAHVFSSNNYMQEDVLTEPGSSSDPNLESHPPHSQRVTEVLNIDQELSSPRNSATVAPASVTFSIPVMSESHQGQEQVLMAVPNVPTMPSACSDIMTDAKLKYVPYMTSSTDNAIMRYQTLQNKSVQEEQSTDPPQQETPSHPLLSDKSCQQCHHDNMLVTLVPCRHAALCRGCADDILESEKRCLFCDQHVTGFIVI